MISFAICRGLTARDGILVLIALAAPSMGFAQRAHDAERQNQTQFVINDEQQNVIESFQVEDSACSRPTIVHIPERERIKGRVERRLQQDMRTYMTEMVGYIYCLRAEFAAVESDDETDQAHMLVAQEHNSAIEELDLMGQTYIERGGSIDELFDEPSIGPESADAAARRQSDRTREAIYAMRRAQSARDAARTQSRQQRPSPPSSAPRSQ